MRDETSLGSFVAGRLLGAMILVMAARCVGDFSGVVEADTRDSRLEAIRSVIILVCEVVFFRRSGVAVCFCIRRGRRGVQRGSARERVRVSSDDFTYRYTRHLRLKLHTRRREPVLASAPSAPGCR